MVKRGGEIRATARVRGGHDNDPVSRDLAHGLEILGLATTRYMVDALAEYFRIARPPGNERGSLAGNASAIARSERFLDTICDRIASVPLVGERRLAARWAARRVLDHGWTVAQAARLVGGLDWGSAAKAARAVDQLPDPARRFAVRYSMTDSLAERILSEFTPEEAEALGSALDAEPVTTLRANRLKTTRDALLEELKTAGHDVSPGLLSADAIRVDDPGDLFRLSAFKEGRFEVQDEGSQLVAELVAPPPGRVVVDFCAGAGGKSLALAAALGGRGQVIALDLPRVERKLAELRRRVRRAGAGNVMVRALVEDGSLPESLSQWTARCDRVLVDAPCSGLGTLRRNPELKLRLDRNTLGRLPLQQTQILDRAATLVGPGGRLIYAVCTLFHAETDAIVDRFLAAHPDFQLMPTKEILGKARAVPLGGGDRLRLLPHVHATDGFFAAVLRRGGVPATGAGAVQT